MKLSVWSSFYVDLSPEDMVLEFERHGYRWCELSDEHSLMLMNRGDSETEGARFKEFADAHGICFPQGHILLRAHMTQEEDRALIMRQLDLFKAIGVKNAVLHCDGMASRTELSLDEIISENIRALRILIDYINDTDIVICLENMSRTPTSITAENLMFFVRELGSEHIGICLDTGHLNMAEQNCQADFIRTAGKNIRALHIADNEGERDQHMTPFGRGNVDIVSVVTEMKKLGYDGLYNLEIPGERKCPIEIRGFKLDYIKKMFDYLDKKTEI